MRRTASSTVLFTMLSLAVLLWAAQAQAHAKLLSADPASSATVAAPKVIHLEFSEEIAKKFSTFKLSDADGHAVAMTAMPSSDGKILAAMPTTTLGPGVYTVSWTAVSTDDGHKTTGTYSFTVQ